MDDPRIITVPYIKYIEYYVFHRECRLNINTRKQNGAYIIQKTRRSSWHRKSYEEMHIVFVLSFGARTAALDCDTLFYFYKNMANVII